jgi:hypothetical protein
MAENTEGPTTKKSPSKKATTKRAPAKKASTGSEGGAQRARAPRAEASRRRSAAQVASEAARQLAELTDKEVEGVTGLRRSDDGWLVEVEALELRRVPTTTDVMAIYEIETDSSGDLQGYRRVRRYVRGQAEGER